jgi:inorganic pyrophosphatase
MIDQGEKDDKIIAVCADDPEYRHYKDIKELPPHRLAEIRRFFEDCILAPSLKLLQLNFANWQQNFMCVVVSNCGSLTLSADKKNENKEVAVDDFLGAESAVKAIGHSM